MFHQRSPRRRALLIAPALALVALAVGGSAGAEPEARETPRPMIVLVHGDWADASSWTSEIERLQRRGFTVVAPPNPLRGPAADAAYVAGYLQSITGPIVLVAHSYGGFVATNAATGNTNVKALVYIDAFMPDEGNTLLELTTSSGSCVEARARPPAHQTRAWPGPR
jgi:pimeloyl-ACP methyl ester carboxylesterase